MTSTIRPRRRANSRLWGGIHWRRDNEVGLDVGMKAGRLLWSGPGLTVHRL